MKKISFIFLLITHSALAHTFQSEIEIKPAGFTNYDGIRYEISESPYLYKARQLKLIIDKEVSQGRGYAEVTIKTSSGEPMFFFFLQPGRRDGEMLYCVEFYPEYLNESEIHVYTGKYQDLTLHLSQFKNKTANNTHSNTTSDGSE